MTVDVERLRFIHDEHDAPRRGPWGEVWAALPELLDEMERLRRENDKCHQCGDEFIDVDEEPRGMAGLKAQVRSNGTAETAAVAAERLRWVELLAPLGDEIHDAAQTDTRWEAVSNALMGLCLDIVESIRATPEDKS